MPRSNREPRRFRRRAARIGSRGPRFAVLVSAVVFASGCVPVASFRPASGLMDDRRVELGAGAVAVGPRPFVEEPARGAAQLWGSFRVGERLVLSGVTGFDSSAFALGGALRYDYAKHARFAAGIEAEGGVAWLGAATPFAVRVVDQTWVYTSPRFASRLVDWVVNVPVGLSVRLYGGWMVRAEYNPSWALLQRAQRRHQAGLAVAYQF